LAFRDSTKILSFEEKSLDRAARLLLGQGTLKTMGTTCCVRALFVRFLVAGERWKSEMERMETRQ
jgi:hypothetical protein